MPPEDILTEIICIRYARMFAIIYYAGCDGDDFS